MRQAILQKHHLGKVLGRFVSAALAVLILAGTTSIARSQRSNPCSEQAIMGSDILRHIKYLASDELKGRETGTADQVKAAHYLADEFKKAGLAPIDRKRRYFQDFKITMTEVGARNRLEANGHVYEEGKDFRVAAVGQGTLEAEVVFAGYGASTTVYDDYRGLDVRNKIVMVFQGKIKKSGKEFALAPFHQVRALTAIQHGAAGMILVEGTSPKDDKIPIPARFVFESAALVFSEAQKIGLAAINDNVREKWGHFPFLYVTAGVANGLLTDSRRTIEQLKEEIDKTGQPLSFALGRLVKVRAEVTQTAKKTMNVVGLVPGRDPELKNQAVIIGAHYDHLGAKGRGKGAEIIYGADDNASGTASLIEIARAFARCPRKPKRSVVFIAFVGEEIGALGSEFYVAHPLFDLRNTKAMFNLDMVGRNDPLAIGVLSPDPRLASLNHALSQQTGLRLDTLEEGYAMSSDHFVFARQAVPFVFYYDRGGSFAHTAKDTWEELSPEKMEKVARLCFLTASTIGEED